jgi:hypothetical protein
MLLAAKTNSLTGADVQPWHLKATFTALDEKGNSTDQGPYEEFWASPTKYKRTFTGTAFTRIDYGPIVSRMLPEPDPGCGSTCKPA